MLSVILHVGWLSFLKAQYKYYHLQETSSQYLEEFFFFFQGHILKANAEKTTDFMYLVEWFALKTNKQR